jgi:hypothetical protein
MSKKLLSVGVVLTLIAAVFVGVASTASAQSMSLCQTVDALVAAGVIAPDKVAAAKAAAGCGSTTSSACYSFTKDLTVGSTGADVSALQAKLSVSQATGYFGAITKAAVQAYQTSKGISATGYVGPLTRAALNACVVTTTTTTTTTTNTSSNSSLSGGEASLESFELSSGDDDEVQEGSSAEIAEIEFDVEDADVEVNRIDLSLVADNANEEKDPWDAFDSLRLLVDGKEIGEVDLSDEDNYLDEDTGTVRLTNLDLVVMEGDTATIVVEITAQNSVDGADADAADWTINVEDDGIRATDSEGLTQEIGSDSETVDFSIVTEGDGEKLKVSTSNEDPESDTFKVEEDAKSDWYTVFAFDLEAEESDIELDTVQVVLETSATTTDMIDDLILEIDGDEFDDWSYVGTTTGSTTIAVEFDINGDATIDADSEVTVVLKSKFKAANGAGYSTSTTNTIKAKVVNDAIEGEGADDVVSDGAATGAQHNLAVAGIIVAESGFDDNTGTSANNDAGTSRDYEFSFTVTAFEEDFYVATSSIVIFTEGAGTVATSTFTVDSTGDEDNSGVFTIEEGQTETFTVIVTISDVSTSGQYRVGLDSVDYTENSDGVSGTSTRDVNNQDFRTIYRNINAI